MPRDRLSRERRGELMSKIRSKGTGIERKFKAAFPSAFGHPDFLPYHPDFVLREGKVCLVVFLDSAFWHGFVSAEKLAEFSPFWRDKMHKNIVMDFAAVAFWRTVQDEVGFVVLTRKGERTWDEVFSAVSERKRLPIISLCRYFYME